MSQAEISSWFKLFALLEFSLNRHRAGLKWPLAQWRGYLKRDRRRTFLSYAIAARDSHEMKSARSGIAAMLCLALATAVPAQMPPPSATAPPPPATASANAKSFSQQELDQLVAPIALYPDALLAQILMGSTYPLEVVYADRWVKANPDLKGQMLEDALQNQPWDPAVKSLTVFPTVLTMMSDKLDWTQKLGDAFLAQEQDVMATVQALRAKAVAEGMLKDSKEQKVTTQTENGQTVIIIEPADPEVVYVPTYDPAVVYGTWPYPAYPPYYWYPPGYYYPGGAFLAGVIVGWALWGNCIWGGGSGGGGGGGGGRVHVEPYKYNKFNRTNISDGTWRHNVNHRGAVPYRDQAVARQYGRGQAGDAATRDAFRGRAEAGRQSIQRGEVSSRDLGAGGGNFGRDLSGTRSPTAFDTGRSAQTRDFSNRGSSSVGSARSSGYVGGGARAGGGMRGGGGRGGGRR
jgi:hypothetical protein